MATLRFHSYGGGSGGKPALPGRMRWAGLNEGHEGCLLSQDGTALLQSRLPVFREKANHAQASRHERLEQTLD